MMKLPRKSFTSYYFHPVLSEFSGAAHIGFAVLPKLYNYKQEWNNS